MEPEGALDHTVSQTWAWASFTKIWPYITHRLPREACKHGASGRGFLQGKERR